MDFKIGDRVELVGDTSEYGPGGPPLGSVGEVLVLNVGGTLCVGVRWDGWAGGHDLMECLKDRVGLGGWNVESKMLRLIEAPLEIPDKLPIIRRKLFAEDGPEIGEQVVRYFCKPGDGRRVKEG